MYKIIYFFERVFFQHNHIYLFEKDQKNIEKKRFKNLLSTFAFPFEIGVYLAT
jgi:hypothetical protein